jgi:hypothetical protein
VQQIKTQCVPVVVGFYDETTAYAANTFDNFFQRLNETSGKPDKRFFMPNGTPFFCAADGTLLKNRLADWAKLPAAQRKPGAIKVPDAEADPERAARDRRLTKPEENTLILRTYMRGLKPGAGGRLLAPRIIDWEYNMKLPAEPNRDFMWLQEAEWQSLIPAEPTKGQTFPVSDAVRDRVCYWHIGGGYHALPSYYSPDRFKSKDMTLTVEDVTPKAISMRLGGSAELTTGATYQFHGLLKYDTQKKTFTRFDLVALCDEGRLPAPRGENVAPYRHYGIAFELSGERTDDLLPPFFLRENGGAPRKYFANKLR